MFLIPALPASLLAQEVSGPFSLEDCINYAIDHNIDIKKQLLGVESVEADLLQSKLNMLPNLNAGGNHIYNWGQTVDRYTNTFATNRVQSNNFYLSSDFTIFSGLRKFNTMKQTQLELQASQYDLDYLIDDISVIIAGYYLDILFNEELFQVAEEQLNVTEQQVNRMKKMVEAGTMAKGDLLNIQAQAATEELQLVNAENNTKLSYLNLMQLIDYPVSEEFIIEKPELRAIEAPSITIRSDDIYDIAVQNRPEIKSAELRVQSAEKSISLARSYISPTLAVTGTWATGYSGAQQEGLNPVSEIIPFGFTESGENVFVESESFEEFQTVPWDQQIKDNNNRSVGLTFQIPIYNGWQVRTAINKAKIAREEATYNLQQTKLELNKEIQQAYLDAVAALNNYNAAEKKVEAQREAFKYAEQRFDVGLMNTVEYNETKKELTKAESELLQAKYNYIFTTTVLDFYMGRPLSIEN
jgi:outer membrane protein